MCDDLLHKSVVQQKVFAPLPSTEAETAEQDREHCFVTNFVEVTIKLAVTTVFYNLKILKSINGYRLLNS